ncbi:transcriptional regulator, AraC family [Azotobacter vinelandii CA]|uniref:Transcriptional regulator, AraC family n=2 Tax=Azotobacter vinelandii TaxID=354 RepID=C1DF31_AZOVD|nr:AraC family transcriptional regulator [Azotobacter vinelandii]ACO80360.1 transcriptional regulator, AraC family [Azotobacter vinelandii DJ]AGK16011.1 transcriptional regulator, AraC family [Azotobacter vinelandii CA]AGK21886.1 transcriptional regulator, AraC family [Azotobacter vinelandii CA6]WKN21144.1 AraC family transcriptional regulator [Azotobacter vinelandii]SFY27642.1 transcriptional regulator, AraC family [Azotobacter vinelandii]
MRKIGDSIPHGPSMSRPATPAFGGLQGSILRSRDTDPDPARILEVPCADAFSIIVQLRDFASHRLWRGKRLAYKGGHVRESMSIAYLGDEVRCQHLAPYDNLRLNLPRASLEETFREAGAGAPGSLDCAQGTLDPVVYHLSLALVPALSMPGEANRLFVDQVMLAMCTHIGSRYGKTGPLRDIPGGLAPWQERRAKEMLAEHLADGLSIAELAAECSLSRAYFSRAFKRSTGLAPHEWLLKMRVEKAKELMLHTSMSLSRIGLDCGFTDQSHFSRVFQKMTGAAPSNWRRFHRTGRPHAVASTVMVPPGTAGNLCPSK